MSWLVARSLLRKSWVWLKHNWYVPALFVWSLFIWITARKDFKAAVEVMDARKKSYEDQIAAIKDAHNREIIKRDNLIKEYNEAMSKVEEEFEKRKENLEEEHEKMVREIIVISKNNPEEIRKRIEKEFGFKYVE